MDRSNILYLKLQSSDVASNSDGDGDPAIDFRCVKPEKLMRLLTERNLALLRLIRERKPASLTELAEMSGRPKASLTRTMQRMKALGIVRFSAGEGRGKSPVVACERLRLEVPLD